MIIRDAGNDDIPQLAQAHLQAFEGFYMTKLGTGFLKEYYRSVFEYDGGILLVASTGNHAALAGFAVGFIDSPAFYRWLRSRRMRLALATVPGLLRDPRLCLRLFQSSGRVRRESQGEGTARDCELASLGVLPSCQGNGVGRLLVQAFLTRSRKMGADRVSLTTDAQDNNRVKHFYQSLGFRLGAPYPAEGGRWMHHCEYSFSMATDGYIRHEVA